MTHIFQTLQTSHHTVDSGFGHPANLIPPAPKLLFLSSAPARHTTFENETYRLFSVATHLAQAVELTVCGVPPAGLCYHWLTPPAIRVETGNVVRRPDISACSPLVLLLRLVVKARAPPMVTPTAMAMVVPDLGFGTAVVPVVVHPGEGCEGAEGEPEKA